MKYCSVHNSLHCTHRSNSTSSKSCPLFPSQRLKSPSSNFIIIILTPNLTLPSLGRRKGQQPMTQCRQSIASQILSHDIIPIIGQSQQGSTTSWSVRHGNQIKRVITQMLESVQGTKLLITKLSLERRLGQRH